MLTAISVSGEFTSESYLIHRSTKLHEVKVDDLVNLTVDILTKYVEKLRQS